MAESKAELYSNGKPDANRAIDFSRFSFLRHSRSSANRVAKEFGSCFCQREKGVLEEPC